MCGKGLTRRERKNPDGKCHKHTLNRAHRVPLNLMRIATHGKKKIPCSSGTPEILTMQILPRKLRQEFPTLLATFGQTHKHGGGIWSLDARPDVRAVRNLSRFCYGLRQADVMSETDSLCIELTGHRLWDPTACAEFQSLLKERPKFDLRMLRKLLKVLEKLDANGQIKVGCATGCAGAHSGLTWLRNTCFSSSSFCVFKDYVARITPRLRNAKGHAAETRSLWHVIAKKKQGVKNPKHLGSYNKMNTYRVCKHAHYRCSPRRSYLKPCADSKFLWDEVLLKCNGGAKKKSVRHGLRSWKKAKQFCEEFRKVRPSFCMCDLACWICLS